MTAADRKYLWFTVTAFVLLGLVGLGALLYGPLRLKYAIRKVEQAVAAQDAPHDINRWIDECFLAARRGNRPAVKAIIEACGVRRLRLSVLIDPGTPEGVVYGNHAYALAEAAPEAFFEVLSGFTDEQARQTIETLMFIALSRDGFRTVHLDRLTGNIILNPAGDAILNPPQPPALVKGLEEHLAKANRPQVRRLLEQALDFTRQRFAKELDAAEKKAAGP